MATRRQVTPRELDILRKKGMLGEELVYIGRGGHGVPGSKRGNPFKISTHTSRASAVEQFEEYFAKFALKADLG